MKQYTTHSAEETRELGKEIAKTLRPKTLVCLTGDLGAGKTTLVQGLLEELGAERPYVSPTFVIMKQYDLETSNANGIVRIYHADAYRVETKDFETIGFSEWLSDPEGLTLLEWPERVAELLPPQCIEISLKSVSETDREISVEQKTA